jgi:putative ABC transport system ATP-binding protein
MLQTQRLVKHYLTPAGARVRAVDEVDLTVGRGELVALYGPSGSGKSTLLELIAAAESPDEGTILVDGIDLASFSDDQLDRYRLNTLGVAPESPHLIAGLTALDLAALRLTEQGLTWSEAHRRVKPLLDRLELGERVDHQAHELSKGERQRLAIAMALATGPSLVLADEPTANLDSRLVDDVLAMLADYSHEHDAAVLLVTHDPAARPHADRVLALRDGKVLTTDSDELSAAQPAARP